MAPFRLGDDELSHGLPWLLMQNGPVTKYSQPELFSADIAELLDRGFTVPRFDCAFWADEYAMYEALISGLELPDYTGKNMDAIDDSLTDMDVPEETGVVVALDNFESCPRGETLLDVMAGASRWWLLFGRMVAVVLHTNDRAVPGPVSLGATAANWSTRE